MSKFQVGDIVKCTVINSRVGLGCRAKVITTYYDAIGVEWDKTDTRWYGEKDSDPISLSHLFNSDHFEKCDPSEIPPPNQSDTTRIKSKGAYVSSHPDIWEYIKQRGL